MCARLGFDRRRVDGNAFFGQAYHAALNHDGLGKQIRDTKDGVICSAPSGQLNQCKGEMRAGMALKQVGERFGLRADSIA